MMLKATKGPGELTESHSLCPAMLVFIYAYGMPPFVEAQKFLEGNVEYWLSALESFTDIIINPIMDLTIPFRGGFFASPSNVVHVK